MKEVWYHMKEHVSSLISRNLGEEDVHGYHIFLYQQQATGAFQKLFALDDGCIETQPFDCLVAAL